MRHALLIALSFFAFNPASYTQNWQWQNPLPQGNPLRDVFFTDNQNGWAVGLGTILHTADGGQNWLAQPSGTTSYLFNVHFTNSQTGWAVGETGTILHTSDGGQNWVAQSSGVSSLLWGVHFTDSQRGWAVGDEGKILYTSDGGQNWAAQSSGVSSRLYGVHFINSQTGWAVGLNGKILHTTDGGQDWIAQSSGTASHLYNVHFADSQNGWAIGEAGTILYTSDGGQNWAAQSSGTAHSLASIHFTNSQTGWAVGYDVFSNDGIILHTVNGGQNWVAQSSGISSRLLGVHFINNQTGWAIGLDGKILHTADGGQSWMAQSSEITAHHLFSVHFADSQNGWAVGRDGTILHTVDGGQGWIVQPSGTVSSLRSVYFINSQMGWAVDVVGTILHTIDGGQVWIVQQSSGTTPTLNSVHFTNSQTGWAVGEAGTVLYTADGGQNWAVQSSGITSSLNSVHFINSQTGWAVGSGGKILHTADGGQNWVIQPSGTSSGLYGVYFANSQNGWAVGDAGTILHTVNGGQNWVVQFSGIPSYYYLSSVYFNDNQMGWAVGVGGVILYTTNGGQNWIPQSSSAASTLNSVYFTDNQNGWVVGDYGTILKYSGPSIFTVTSPQLTLSAAQLNPGQILTFTGTDFTPSNTATLFISKPDGTQQEMDVPTNAFGTFTYNYAVPNTLGSYSVNAQDVTNGKFTVSKVFQVNVPQPPVDYLKISSPIAMDVFYTDNFNLHYFPVKFSDKMFLDGAAYPIQGGYRLYKYNIEYSLNNGPWQYVGQQSGLAVVNDIASINYKIQTPITGGSYRVRITDVYNPIRMKISPVFTIQVQNTGLKADFLWDYSYIPQPTATLDGVAADGVGRFYIKVHKQGAMIESASILLEYTFGGEMGKVMKATVTDQYSTEANQASDISAINTPGADNSVWFWYVAPENFVSEPADELKRKRTIIAQIVAYFMDGSQEVIFKEIDIVRPPVMLAHGLAGSAETWDNFRLSNGTLFKNDPRFMLSPWAITLDPFASFKYNATTLVQHPNYNSIPALISDMHNMGYACNQVDYICHSMGGSVMRYCLSPQIENQINNIHLVFKGNMTYGRGMANKIITINTPHNGSPLADLANKFIITPTNIIHPLIQNAPFFKKFFINGQPVPAVIDLQVDPTGSKGGVDFSATSPEAKIHRIASNIECADYVDPAINKIWKAIYNVYDFNWIGAPTCYELKNMFEDFSYDPTFFDASDLVVATKSQLAGDNQFTTTGSKTVYSSYTHSTPFNNRIIISPSIADRVFELLNKDVNSLLFGSLPASVNFINSDEANIKPLNQPIKIIYNTTQKSNGKIQITSPSPGDTLTMDEAVQLGISVLDTTGFRKVNVLFQDELYSSVTPASLLNFNTQINGNLIEKQKIIAVGYYYTSDSGAVQYVDEIEVYITTPEPIAVFEASPQVNWLEKGQNFRPTYTARFSTNIGELGNSPELTVMIENPAVLAYLPDDNSFTAVDSGTTYAVVTYKGLSDTLFFLIVDPPDSVIIDPPGSVSAAFNYQTVPCANAQANFTNTSSGATSYLWEFGDGNFSTLPNPTHQYAEPGAYNVILSATNGATGETDLIVHTVNVSNTSALQAAISPAGSIALCDGDTITLSANADTGYTYQWLRNGNPVVNGNNQQYVAYQWGFFTVRVTDATGCSTVSAPTIVTITPSPTVTVALQGPAEICPGDSTSLKATASSSIYYQWFLNGVDLPGATSTNLIATASGDYTIMATNSFGCTRMSFSVTVAQLPAPAITASADDYEICIGDAAVLSSSGGISYTWNPGNLIGEIIDVTPTVSTIYTVTGTGSNGCTASKDLPITVFPEPFVEIGNDTALSLNQVLHLDAGPGFSAYFWSTGATTQSIDFVVTQQLSLISVQVIDTNGCVGFDIIAVEPLVGTKDIDKYQNFSMQKFPNPTSGILNIRIEKSDASFEEVEFSVFDMFGQVVLRQRQLLQSNKSTNTLDLTRLPSGSYAVQIKIGIGVVITVVQRF